MWLVKVFPYFPRRVPANCMRAPNEQCIMHARKMRATLSLSLFLPLFSSKANTTLTNQLAVNHLRARNNLHTRAQNIHVRMREEARRRILLIRFSPSFLTLTFEESDPKRTGRARETEDAGEGGRWGRGWPKITGSRKQGSGRCQDGAWLAF